MAARRANDNRHVTMKEVARRAGVSASTVSRILSGATTTVPIAEKTRARVLAAAAEVGYQPNPMARALRGAPTMLIGAIIRDIRDPFFATAIDMLSLQARRSGYSVLLGHAREEDKEALALAGVLETRQCDAIVLLGNTRSQPRLVEDLITAKMPVVELWQGSRPREFPVIDVDNVAGTRLALGHLAELGHRRIAFAGDATAPEMQERLATYVAFMEKLGTGVPAGYDQPAPDTVDGGVAAFEALLELPEPPTAIATTDVLATVILHQAYERGVSIPTELSVTGFDDSPFAKIAVPPLTTVQMPVEEMLEATVRLVIAFAEGERSMADEPSAELFRPQLIVRGSTGPPRA